jgi:MinD-like ATPase involved in chromosome partitioning or flagellar assembly
VEQQHRLLGQIWELNADVVIADVGPDPADELVDLFELGALRLFVATADPRSVRRAYAFFKDEVAREIEHVAGGTCEADALLTALAAASAVPMSELMKQAAAKPNIREALEQSLGAFGGRMVGNQVRTPDDTDLLHAASRLIAEYLGIAVPVLGGVELSTQLNAARLTGRPLLLGSGIDRNVRLFHSIAEQLLMDTEEAEAARCVARPRIAAEAMGVSVGRLRPDAESDGEDADADAALPAPLGSYMRRHPRHPVDWLAIYRSESGREVPVRIFELSISGASIDSLPGIDVGDRGCLVFAQVANQPQMPVTVLATRRPLGRAGLRFEGSAEVCALLARLAAAVRGG